MTSDDQLEEQVLSSVRASKPRRHRKKAVGVGIGVVALALLLGLFKGFGFGPGSGDGEGKTDSKNEKQDPKENPTAPDYLVVWVTGDGYALPGPSGDRDDSRTRSLEDVISLAKKTRKASMGRKRVYVKTLANAKPASIDELEQSLTKATNDGGAGLGEEEIDVDRRITD